MFSVSVIIPMYNAKEFINETLISLVNQSFTLFEVIIVNDGSTDNSEEIVKSFCNKLNINLITIPNGGAANARKIGVINSKSDYLFFLDSDDLLPINAIKNLYETAIVSNSDVIVGQNSLLINNKLQTNAVFGFTDLSVIQAFLLQKLPFTLWSSLYKKQLFAGINYFEDFIVGEDFLINCQIFSNPILKVTVIKESVYLYRRHLNSITKQNNSFKTKQNYLAYTKGIEIIETHFNAFEIKNEMVYNKLCFLFSMLLINSKDVTNLVENIKRNENNIIKQQLKVFNWKKRILLHILIYSKFPTHFIRFIIVLLKVVK